jgi:hypothetical protein
VMKPAAIDATAVPFNAVAESFVRSLWIKLIADDATGNQTSRSGS